jgi:hypothetical protein
MTLPCLIRMSRREVKGAAALALDTGYGTESLEGRRLVKASRGSGWFYFAGTLRPWSTRGVLQEEGRLVVWGELTDAPDVAAPDRWPLDAAFLRSFAQAWTARAAAEPLGAFSPSAVLPLKAGEEWAFVFLPGELASVLDAMIPLTQRLAWDHVRHPDLTGEAGWAFATAALSLAGEGQLPWAQDDEAALRQEIRELKTTLREAELPDAPTEVTRRRLDALKGKGTAAAWSADDAAEARAVAADPERRRSAAAARQARRRTQSFWRRRGTVVGVVSAAAAVVLAIAASLVWGWLKPDVTDTWTPEQVVRGYYQALDALDSERLRKLTSFNHFNEHDLSGDLDQATRLYVLKQVRTAYEKQDPIVDAEQWEAQGKPELAQGRQLYGLAGLTLDGGGDRWTARYRRWVSDASDGRVTITGASVTDKLKLVRTGRGWKIASLTRESLPLP